MLKVNYKLTIIKNLYDPDTARRPFRRLKICPRLFKGEPEAIIGLWVAAAEGQEALNGAVWTLVGRRVGVDDVVGFRLAALPRPQHRLTLWLAKWKLVFIVVRFW